MTLYAGEPVLIRQSASSRLGVVTPDNVEAVLVAVYHQGTEVLAETPMTWDPAAEEWFYLWDTTGQDFGGYRAQVRVDGLVTEGSPIEYKSFRLNRRPT